MFRRPRVDGPVTSPCTSSRRNHHGPTHHTYMYNSVMAPRKLVLRCYAARLSPWRLTGGVMAKVIAIAHDLHLRVSIYHIKFT